MKSWGVGFALLSLIVATGNGDSAGFRERLFIEDQEARYDQDVAVSMVAYAAIVTCENKEVVESWRCKLCGGNDAKVPPPPALEDVGLFKGEQEINQGLVGYDAAHERVVVSFRGSVSPWQYIYNLNVFLETAYGGNGCVDCRVHKGFYDAYKALDRQVRSRVRVLVEEHKVSTIWVTGHSLGAAIATHAAVAIREMLVDIDRTDVDIIGYTFGQPRVGDKGFAKWFKEENRQWFRVVNFHDPVPQCFKLPGYHHMTTEVYYYNKPEPGNKPGEYRVCSSKHGEDSTCQDRDCGGLRFCLNGDYHVTYMNIPGITNTTLIC
mmetsp:Transcript_9798/g.18393  ORF Transcript_9798/g.18393 Transcript_9798/m.18393 type:complete len:321 (+) Transcript_9798:384-1346(+)